MKTSRALSELFFLLCDSIKRILDDLENMVVWLMIPFETQ